MSNNLTPQQNAAKVAQRIKNPIKDSELVAAEVINQTAIYTAELNSVRLEAPSIASQNDADRTADEIRTKKDFKAKAEVFYKAFKDSAYRAHRATVAHEAEIIDPLKKSIDLDERTLGTWLRDEDRKRREEADRLQRQTDAAFDKEVDKRAGKLEKAGKTEEADQLREQAAVNRPTISMPAVEAPKGTSAPKVEYDFEITDPDAVPRAWCEPSDKKIKGTIAALGKNAAIPGVRIFQKDPKATVRR